MATPFSRLGYALLCVLLTGLGRPGDFEFNEILIPETFERPAPTVENRRIFQGWEHLPQSVREFETPPGKIVEEMALPAGNLLVVANPANLARAYALIGDAVKKAELEVSPPLMIVIHADDNVSVGLRVDGEDIPPLPLGADISPLPPMRWLLVRVELEEAAEARRAEPAFVRAAARLRLEARERNLQLHARELYLFPGQENTLLFGMRVENN
ncbi:MAG: hypothetical protein LAT83_08095 [Kiritimatiellae bacterium]|nr:hypothetical protein [Kiritimatiellia bacterium]